MTDHDHLFKELLKTYFVEFIDLFLPHLFAFMDVSKIEFLDKEVMTDVVSGDTYEADLLAKVSFKQQNEAFFLVHMEHQAQPQKTFNRRMFLYFALTHLNYGLPVYPIAIFSDASASRDEPDTYQVAFPDMDVLNFQYRVIQLRKLPWRRYANVLNPVACALLPKMKMKPYERPTVLLTSLRLLARLGLDAARKRFLSGFINTYLRLNEKEKEQFQAELAQLSPHEQEVTMELTTTWKEEGIKEGWQKGLLEGEQKGEQKGIQKEALYLTQRLLTRRIGVLTPAQEERIGKLAKQQLEQLFDAAYDFATRDDLHTWLDNNPPESGGEA